MLEMNQEPEDGLHTVNVRENYIVIGQRCLTANKYAKDHAIQCCIARTLLTSKQWIKQQFRLRMCTRFSTLSENSLKTAKMHVTTHAQSNVNETFSKCKPAYALNISSSSNNLFTIHLLKHQHSDKKTPGTLHRHLTNIVKVIQAHENFWQSEGLQ